MSCGASKGSWKSTETNSRKLGMSSSLPDVDARAKEVLVSDDELTVSLWDGRRVSVPLAWFPRLLHATSAQRRNYELLGEGVGIHWPDLDEDLSVAGLLRGTPSASR
jgi:hypothetical protein